MFRDRFEQHELLEVYRNRPGITELRHETHQCLAVQPRQHVEGIGMRSELTHYGDPWQERHRRDLIARPERHVCAAGVPRLL